MHERPLVAAAGERQREGEEEQRETGIFHGRSIVRPCRVTIILMAGWPHPKERTSMSPRLTPTLLAIALASTLGFAPASTLAQTVQTSKGMRTLPRTDGFHSEAQYASAMRVAEGIADQVLADIAVIE